MANGPRTGAPSEAAPPRPLGVTSIGRREKGLGFRVSQERTPLDVGARAREESGGGEKPGEGKSEEGRRGRVPSSSFYFLFIFYFYILFLFLSQGIDFPPDQGGEKTSSTNVCNLERFKYQKKNR